MTLRRLFINESAKCSFHEGLNLVVGANRSRDGEVTDAQVARSDELEGESTVADTNGVGKTLLVNTIKHVLAGDVERVFSSAIFERDRYWAAIEVVVRGITYSFARALWSPLADDCFLLKQGSIEDLLATLADSGIASFQSIQDRHWLERLLIEHEAGSLMLTKEAFKREISRLEAIDYSQANLTFSALLDFVIRDEKVGFSDPISRIRRSQWVQYRSVLYLFGLPALFEGKSKDLLEKISRLEVELKGLKARLREREITNDDRIVNLEESTKAKLRQVMDDIKAVKVSPSIETLRSEYQSVRQKYADLDASIVTKERYLRAYIENRDALRNKTQSLSDLIQVPAFFEELVGYFPDQVSENIDKFYEFFENLAKDRREYYTALIEDIKADLKLLRVEIDAVKPRLDEISERLRGSSLLADVHTLASRESALRAELTELGNARSMLSESEAIEERIQKLKNQRQDLIAQGKRELKGSERNRRALIGLFHAIVAEVYGVEDAELSFEYNSSPKSTTAGRTEIVCQIPSQNSHGRTYAKINIFDFVWFFRQRGQGEFDPGFLIHDGSYSKISRDIRVKLLAAAEERSGPGKQYIVTVNDGEVEWNAGLEQSVCCRLDGNSAEGKLFGIQFD